MAALGVACSTVPSNDESVGSAQGPLSGTYAADALDGDAPFAAITFLDERRYVYVAKTCVPADNGDGSDLGDDPGDPVADGDATPATADADPTDRGCLHAGTYTVTSTTLALRDDGASHEVSLSLASIDADGDEVQDPDAETVGSTDQGSLLGTQSLGTRAGASLILGGGSLLGQRSVSQFAAGGTRMRRTGLARGSGVGTACTIDSGAAGTCQRTSTCASQGKLSTRNFCPGPYDVQCCTAKASSSPGSSGSTPATGDDSLVGNGPVALARQWVAVKMPYCQAVNGGTELDRKCVSLRGSRTCNRTGAANRPSWNGYRSDCSGLVSFAWGLKAPGLTTRGFLPGAAKYVPTQDLQPGDALVRPGRHVVLFARWIDKDKGQATVIAEPGCASRGGAYAQEQTWSLGAKPGAQPGQHWSSGTYYAIRSKTGWVTN